MNVVPGPDRRNSELTERTGDGHLEPASVSLTTDIKTKHNPNQIQNEILVDALLSKLPVKIAQEFPAIFRTPPSISKFAGSGFMAIPFEIMAAGTGERYLLKLRPYLDNEVRVKQPVEALKEIWARNQANKAGVPVAGGTQSFTLFADELPRSLEAIQVRFGKLAISARERSYVVSIQNFVEGAPARLSIQDDRIQLTAQKELGQKLRKLHTIEVSGFGNEFDLSSQSFSKSWVEFRDAFKTIEKAKELELQGILSRAEVKTIEDLIKPLNCEVRRAVLLHRDLNPGNYLISDAGNIRAVLDWDNTEGGPWQYDLAGALGNIEASSFGIPYSSIPSRIAAFLDGYGITKEDLTREKPIIDAFRVSMAIGHMHDLYVAHQRFGFKYLEGEYRSISEGTYNRQNKSSKEAIKETIPDAETDLIQGLLGSERILRSLISNYTAT